MSTMTATLETATVTAPSTTKATVKAPVKSRTSGTKAPAPKATATRTPTKVERKETAKAMTAADRRKQDALIKVIVDGVASVKEYDSKADELRVLADGAKVATARAVGKLMDSKESWGTRGTAAGQPANLTMSRLTGIPESTLAPYFKAAKELRKFGYHTNTGKPSVHELAIVRGQVESENDARYERAAKQAKETAKSKNGKVETVAGAKATYELVKTTYAAALETLTKFAADGSFTKDQANELATILDQAHDVIESALVK